MKKWPIAGAAALIALVAIAGAAVALMGSADDSDDGSSASRSIDEDDGSGTAVAPICIEGAIDCDDTIEEPVSGDPDEPVSNEPITIIDGQDPTACNLTHNIDACEEAAAALAIDDLSLRLGSPETITVQSVEFVQWPDSCLGISKTDVACAEVITPGFRIILAVGESRFEYHTDTGTHAEMAE